MPLYEYECDACQHRFEVIQKYSDPLVAICPNCGGHVRKLMSSPAIQFKGTGWYITDYAKKEGPSASSIEAKSDQASANSKEGSQEGSKGGSKETSKDGSAKNGGASDSGQRGASEKDSTSKTDANAGSSDSGSKPAANTVSKSEKD